MKEIKINGRYAVPVRLISFMTEWSEFAPDSMARKLTHRGEFDDAMTAYHLLSDTEYREMKPKEWDRVVGNMEVLTIKMKQDEELKNVKNLNNEAWRKQAIEKLPSSVFVWLDDLKAVFGKVMGRKHFAKYPGELGDDVPVERPGDRELNLSPHIPPDQVKIVFDGFPQGEYVALATAAGNAEPKQPEPKNVQTAEERIEARRQRLESAITAESIGKAWGGQREVWATHQIPDWEFWRDMPEVELWQACALSLNLDPYPLTPSDDGMGMGGESYFKMRNFPNEETWEKFNKRRRLLEAHMRQPNGRFSNSERLSDFVTWALSLSTPWDMPPKLKALAKKTAVRIGALETEPTPDDTGRKTGEGEQEQLEQEAKPLLKFTLQKTSEAKPQKPSEDEATESKIAALFPLATFAALENMFPAGGKWKIWVEKAGRNGLKAARQKRGLLNPYLASEWWLTKKKPQGWDSEKCLKVLAKNHPEQTQDYHELLFPGRQPR